MKHLFIYLLFLLFSSVADAKYDLPESTWIKLENNLYIDSKNIYKVYQDEYIKFFTKTTKGDQTNILKVQLMNCKEKRIGTKIIIEIKDDELVSSKKNKKVPYTDILEYTWDEKLYKYLCN